MDEATPELEDRVGMQLDCRIVAFPEVRPTEHLFCVIVTRCSAKIGNDLCARKFGKC